LFTGFLQLGPRGAGLLDAKDDRIVKHVERSFSDKSPKAV
jgi:hypothetical protein